MLEQAIKYHNFGLSVIPIGKDKIPTIKWKGHTEQLIMPKGNFKNCYGIGICCGVGGVEVIDIDCKYDLTGSLLNEYKLLINSQDKEILKKLAVQKTVNGGYHFIYKTNIKEGNKKLASREATQDELKAEPKEKQRVLIETRGQGGYFAIAPTKGYEIIYGAMEGLWVLTDIERNILFDCAKTFNQVFKPEYVKTENKKIIQDNLSSFDDYNNRADILDLLQSEGWKIKLQRGSKYLLLRPGGTGKWSADWDEEKRLLYIFTSSTDFEINKAYNPVQIITKIKFNDDYSASSKWLFKNGYGEQKTKSKKTLTSKIDVLDDDFNFVAQNSDTDEYIEQVRAGTFKMGLGTGFSEFDEYFRFKPSNFVITIGQDNVGKSFFIWYLSVLSAKIHGWNWIIYSSENKMGGVKKKLMEFYLCKKIKTMNDDEYLSSKKWVEEHFTIIKNLDLYTYKDMINIGNKLIKKKHYDAFMIDPYNSLQKDLTGDNEHQYDYQAANELRLFTAQTGCGIYLNCHTITEALRRKYPKGHIYENHAMPPHKADIEGGGKFLNKSDDVLIVHRMAKHKERWMITEIHVDKIKEEETGGRKTYMDEPFELSMTIGSCGFADRNGFNPIDNTVRQSTADFTEPMNTKYLEQEPPF